MTQLPQSGQESSALAVERHSIDFVPRAERHGHPRSLFAVWFASNMQVTALVTGALAVIVGLSLPYALLSVVIGVLIGAVAMALHSAQGPKLGIPQMVQSRAQFGFYGANVPIVIVILMYIGFFAISAVLGGAALADWTGMSISLAIVLLSAACMLFTIYGYRVIHRLERVSSVISALGFLLITIKLFTSYDVSTSWHAGHFSLSTFLLAVSIAATWQITYAPYVADYARYLPESTSVRSCFWWTYAGSSLGTLWMMAVGCIAASVAANAFEGGSTAFLVALGPHGTQGALSAVIILGIVAVNVLNLYGAFMSATTILTTVGRDTRVGRGMRITVIAAITVVSTVLAVAGRGNFVGHYEDFILFLSYFLIPWTAINLVDFYLVRKERYVIADVFTPLGRYGALNVRCMVAYLLGVVVEVPFMSTSFYTGTMVGRLGGADVSWILGLVVAAVLYYVLCRHEGDDVDGRVPAHRPAARADLPPEPTAAATS